MQQQPYYNSLTQQQLKSLYNTTGAILLLDIPQGIQFGIDNILWKVGQKFKGIKFIPFGPHIISYTLKQQNNQFKINKFIYLDQSKHIQTQYIILKWSHKYSIFMQLRGAQAEGYRQGIRKYHFDSYLGQYPSQNIQFWKQNTTLISRQLLQKLQPIQKIYKFQQQYTKIKQKPNQQQQQVRIDIDQQQDDVEQILQQQKGDDIYENNKQQQLQEEQNNLSKNKVNSCKNNSEGLSKKFQPLSDTIYYSQIPRILTNDPKHINQVNLNKTPILIQIINKQYLTLPHQHTTNPSHPLKNQHNNNIESKILYLLGQLQYSFIYFLVGQDQQSFQQWKKLINLFVFSQDIFQTKQSINMKKNQLSQGITSNQLIIQQFQQIALQFIVVLYNQFKQFPVDFFIGQLSKNSFMQTCLKRLHQYKTQQEGMISKKVKKRLQKLFKLLLTKFNYELNPQNNDDLDEDAPIIVNENQNYF